MITTERIPERVWEYSGTFGISNSMYNDGITVHYSFVPGLNEWFISRYDRRTNTEVYAMSNGDNLHNDLDYLLHKYAKANLSR